MSLEKKNERNALYIQPSPCRIVLVGSDIYPENTVSETNMDE